MDPHLAEDEELAKLKEWWRKNGMSIIVGIAVGLGAIVGINGWNLYTSNRAETASALFFQLRQHIDNDDANAAAGLADELQSDFSATPYAANGALLTAAALYDAGDIEGARERLGWVLDQSEDPNLQHTARLRLAYLELGEGNPSRALELATVDEPGAFASHYAEIRADAHRLDGSDAAAASAYDDAIAALPAGSGYANVLRAKRNSLTGSN